MKRVRIGSSPAAVIFAAGHTLGFRQSDPNWGVDAVVGSMRSAHFDVQGFNRTYWDLFVAAGFSVGVFYLFAAILSWQLGGLPAATLALMRGTVWAFAFCFGAITVVSSTLLIIDIGNNFEEHQRGRRDHFQREIGCEGNRLCRFEDVVKTNEAHPELTGRPDYMFRCSELRSRRQL